jgi:GTP-binding protein Era
MTQHARAAPTGGTTSKASTDDPVPTVPRCGLVAIVGRPNVGKSTLLNALVGQKVSITSRKPQTTRHRILGVRTCDGGAQFVFVDTPGFQTRHGNALNRNLNRTVRAVLGDVDIVLFVVEAGRFGLDDAKVLSVVPEDKPVLLVANKLDRVVRRAELAPWLKSMQERHDFAEYVPLSAHHAADVDRLLGIVARYLPAQPWFYDAEMLTDRNDRFLAAEIVREKVFRLTGDEVPYGCTVVIDRFEEEQAAPAARGSKVNRPPRPAMRRIDATIVVDRDSHKGMVIGEGGERLKRIGTEARQDLERLYDAKVHLQLWVKVKGGWADEESHLRSYGYE